MREIPINRIFILIIAVMFVACSGEEIYDIFSDPVVENAPEIVLSEHEMMQSYWEYVNWDENRYSTRDETYQGNCEDYALELFSKCILAGFPKSWMSVEYCTVPEGRHAVLIAANNDDEWFLFDVNGDYGVIHNFQEYKWDNQWVEDMKKI